MKRIVILFFLLLGIYNGYAQFVEFYYHKGDTVNLEINTQYFFVYFDLNKISCAEIQKQFRAEEIHFSDDNICCAQINYPNNNYKNVLSVLRECDYVVDVEPTVGNGKNLTNVTRRFYVKLKSETDFPILQAFAHNTRSVIVGSIPYSGDWYALEVDKFSSGNSIELAKLFFETGFFADVDPGFGFAIAQSSDSECVTDVRVDEQWGLRFIKACKAWKITTGDTNIRVAVIDGGIDTSHLEFNDLNTVFSYDMMSQSSPANVYIKPKRRYLSDTDTFDLYHGIHVGGIIFANHDEYSIAGIAPNISAIDISYNFSDQHPVENLSVAINLAVENGANIINNSWHINNTNTTSSLIEDAIDNALSSNCVVVFSSGSSQGLIEIVNENIPFPANYSPEILVVGAIESSGNWYELSFFGTELDISAPGVDILSTHNNNGYCLMSGTSMAASHVSGVAALMLSINPNLSAQEVRDIIETTAQKVGATYYNEPEHHNGLWTDEIGYGVVDAHRAVLKAAFNRIYGDTSLQACNSGTYTVNASHNANIDSVSFIWSTSPNLKIVGTNGTPNVQVRAIGTDIGTLYCQIVHDGDTVTSEINIQITSSITAYNNITLTENMVFPDSILIDGNIQIDSMTNIVWQNTNVLVTPTSNFIVRPGGKLVVDGGTLTSACAGEMWQGVQVLGNSGLSQNAANQGWLELKNGALIENARCAVQAEAGAVVKATNTDFRNNGRAVNIMPYVETMPGGGVRGNLSGFGNCTFTTDGDNLFAENGCEFTEHVRMSEVNGIEFHSCSFSDATAGGFTTHRGIYAQDAGFTLTKTCPSNIVFTGCVCAESYSRYNTFSGFNTAIEANTSGNQYAIEIDQTRFSGNGTAVRINGNNFVTVTRDTFDLTQSVSQPPFVTGLYLNNCSGYKVEGNHFKGLVMANVGSTTGVIVNNSGSADNTIYRNSFSSLNYGVQVRGDNGGAHGGLQVACGSFSNVNNTIYLAGGATMKSTDNVTINNCASTLCGITPGFPGHPFPVNAAGANPANFAGANGHSTLQTEVYYAAVRGIMADTVLDLGALQQWHTVAQPIADRYSLTETDFQMGIVDDVEGGDADYAQFHAMKAQLRDGEMVNWRDMTEAQKTELQEIAEHNSGRASEMAKGVLCFYHGICLEDGDLSAEDLQGGTKSAKTAINKAENAGLYVYPNPTDGELNVEITDGTQITAITLCDLQGRVVWTQNFASQHGASLNGGTTVITMQNIPAGVYILTVTDLNGVIYHQKIIKK